MLEVRGLTAGYGDVIGVRDLTLSVAPGEIVAVLGANGAGKTTSLNAIYGVIKPRRGVVEVNGTDVTGAEPRTFGALGCSLVPEGRGLFPSMTIEEHLRLGAFQRPKGEIDGALQEIYERWFPALRDRRTQLAGTLSGGEQQMLAVARGLMAAPRLLMIDELSLGLAPIVIDQLYRSVTEVARDRALALLVVEQHAAVALQHADRVYVLEASRLRFESRVADLAGLADIHQAYLGLEVDHGVEVPAGRVDQADAPRPPRRARPARRRFGATDRIPVTHTATGSRRPRRRYV